MHFEHVLEEELRAEQIVVGQADVHPETVEGHAEKVALPRQ